MPKNTKKIHACISCRLRPILEVVV